MAGALIGALRVSLSAETTAFEAGMNRSQAIAKRTAANLNTTFGGTTKILERTALRFAEVLTLAAIVRAGKAALEYAGHLGELADTLGLTTKDLQTFSYAAGQVGISQEELQVGIQKLTVSMGQAETGAKKQINAFKAIGISVDDLKNKTTGDIFREIADKLQTVSDRSQRAAIEVALFGKAGAKLDNLLSGSQGRLNELSDAAERLGIVLSDEQIRKADQTADKIAALMTVLKAQVAGAVADNADAILGLANALSALLSNIGPAIQGWRILIAEFKAGGNAIAHLQNPFAAADNAANEIRLKSKLQTLRGWDSTLGGLVKPQAVTGGADIGQFLGGSGGKKHKEKVDHTPEKLAREAYEAQRQELQAQQDILQAKRDLSEDYVEQTSISIDILNNQREQKKAELEYNVKQHALTKGLDGLTQAQADKQLALYDQADSLKRQKVLQDEQEQRQRDVGMLVDHDFERRKDLLGKQEDLATTQSERRKIELDLLQLAYEEKRQALQRIVDTSKDAAAIEDARRDLINLKAGHAADRQGVLNRTRGPLEEWAATVPKTAAEINEALQSIEAQGLDGLSDAISDVISGTRSLKSAFGDLARSIISDIIKMTIRMLVFRAISSIFGSAFSGGGLGQSAYPVVGGVDPLAPLPGFARGGSFAIGGNPGIDRNTLSLNGLPIARVSMRERISIGNDNGGGGATVYQTIAPNFAGNAATHEDVVRMAALTKAATMEAIRDQRRRT